jgi:hypothetical protein
MQIEGLRQIARRQQGLFTSRQARECGFTAQQIGRRLTRGVWQRVWGRVLAEAGLWVTAALRDRAVQLGVRGSVLGGLSAARLWGMPVPESDPCLIVSRRRRPIPGVLVLTDALTMRDRTFRRGIPVTTQARTVFDCLRLLPEAAAMDLLDRALQQRWITLAELTQRLTGFVGRPGVARILRLTRLAAGGTRFPAEHECARLFLAAGLRGWTPNATVRDQQGVICLGDFVFEKGRLVVEVDGFAFHVTAEQFQHDRRRQNRLIQAGWTVLRFTWRDLRERPDYVVGTVRRVLQDRG